MVAQENWHPHPLYGECPSCWRAANALFDLAAHADPRGVRAWYRDAGIIGYSRHRDIAALEVRFPDGLAERRTEAEDWSRIVALVHLAHEDGYLVVAHALNGRSLRQLARDEAVPFSTLRRRYQAALAAMDQGLVFGESGTRRHPFRDSLSSDDAA